MFQQAFLHALGAPPIEFTRLSERNGIIVDHLEQAETRIVLIDEAQHFLAVSERTRRQMYDWMKYLSTESRLPFVLAGVRGCEVPIRTEPQLTTRFRIIPMLRWKEGPELAQFLNTYERICPLRRASHLATPAMMKAIVRESGGLTDYIVRSLSYAASIAIHEGEERITEDLLPLWTDPNFIPMTKGDHNA
jgi:hypothetical protein